MFVSNASTLIILAKSDALSLLLDYAKKIEIPAIVYQEIAIKGSYDALLIKNEVKKKRIVLVDVDMRQHTSMLAQFRLDEGEAAAYASYKQKKADGILTDDSELIKLCKIEGIPFTTAMAAIVKLFNNKRLTAGGALEKLDEVYKNGWYTKELYNFFREQVK